MSVTASNTYETDFVAWAEEQAALLRKEKFEQLDLENLIEEVQDLGNRHRDAIESQLTRLLMHLLKWQFQPEKRGISWESSIKEARKQIYRLLRKYPSLKNHLEACFEQCYQDAREDAADETRLPLTTFPPVCPFTLEQALTFFDKFSQ